MQLLIGLDGGGTGCRAQGWLGDGRRTEIVTGGAANVFSDFAQAQREIAALLAQVTELAQGLAAGHRLAPPQIVLGLAGARQSDAPARLRAALPYSNLIILGDLEIALAGAFGGLDGIVMAVGTGSVLGRQQGGKITCLGGHGLALGDEGSGAWIGREALRRAFHARDGVGPDGPLIAEIWRRFDAVNDVIAFSAGAKPLDYAAFAPMVLRHDPDCPVARAILDQGCAYLARAITCLQGGQTGLPVAPLGGLGPILLERIKTQGRAAVQIMAPKGTALEGALQIARAQAQTTEPTQ